MGKTKLLIGMLLTLVMLSFPLLSAAAQTEETPPPEPTPVTLVDGIINSITLFTCPITQITTVEVSLTIDTTTHLLSFTVEEAVVLGLVTVSTDPEPVISIVETMIGQTISIDSSLLPTEPVEEEVSHPIALILGDYLGKLLGVDAAEIEAYHEEGFGFGVIAQAGLLSLEMEGDAGMMDALLTAKQTGDFSTITLPDGTIATNWGQVKKSIMSENKNGKNLGSIVSGHASDESIDEETQDTAVQSSEEHGAGQGKGQGNNKNPGRGGGKDK